MTAQILIVVPFHMYIGIFVILFIHLDIRCNAETRIEVSAPVNPIDEGAILSVHCQIWNLQKGQEVTIFRNRTKQGVIERLSLDNKVHIEDNNVFLAERQMLDGSVVYFLSIMAATRTDEGEYSCKISSVTGSGSHDPIDSVKIHFTYFPSEPAPLCSPNGPLTVKEGSDVSFECSSALGNPIVSIQWKRAGTASMLKSNVEKRITNGRVHSSLSFTPSQTNSGAVFICAIKSPAFPSIERTCHVGPITVINRNGDPYPVSVNRDSLSVDSEPIDIIGDQFTIKPTSYVMNSNTQKTEEFSCDEQCPVLIPGSPIQFWIIATIAAAILTIIFLILGVVIMIKYYRLTNLPKVEYMSALPHSEEIYVEVDGKRRENCMYMSLEKSKKPVLQPIQMAS